MIFYVNAATENIKVNFKGTYYGFVSVSHLFSAIVECVCWTFSKLQSSIGLLQLKPDAAGRSEQGGLFSALKK